MHSLYDIRIGTLVDGRGPDVPARLRALLPLGFESFSITYWQDLGEVDLARQAEEVRGALATSTAVISSLAVFGNPLERDDQAAATRAAWAAAIRHAHDFGCDVVGGFAGRLRGLPLPDSIPRFVEIFAPLAELAAKHGVRLAFENCAMGGTWASGDWNIAHNPDAWELMFAALPAAHVGLEWEPCHQLVQLIDAFPQLDAWHQRIFHVHGKDASIDRHRLARHGFAGKREWSWHRTPGFGDSDWTAIISRLRQVDWKGSIDIEGWHDPVYRDELEMNGQVQALRHLQQCRGGIAPVLVPKG